MDHEHTAITLHPGVPVRRVHLVWLVLVLALGVVRPSFGQQADLPMPTSFTTRYLVLFSRAEAAPAGAALQRLLHEHVQYQLRLQADSVSVAGGPFGEGGDSTLVGMTILRASDMEAARRIAGADPAVRQGYFRVRVLQWLSPVGQLP